ncbi:MAG: NAD(P)H-dependent oxidoreductase subunit E [Alphaproteobacteria bacterium]|nr:NAD(P)H-dependent oxidoreductase subunit E [Alphaproteobacteria bacterium]MDE2011635.1 NAD(P)H-dependent oxidoreductase subunit E [Alphaproteobacteria bacterium]MDE2073940.1 NAD(P)H-dependent oxidoreductase subunit E [Alphaproteobacteria bacterium]
MGRRRRKRFCFITDRATPVPPAAELWNEARAREIAETFANTKGGLLPALLAIQSAFGHVPGEAVVLLAEVFNVSRAEVHGAVTFYRDFRERPAGRHVLKLCRAEACQAAGSVSVAEVAKRRLKLGWDETDSEGNWTLEPVFCLGLCACGPAGMLDGTPLARLDGARIEKLIDGAAE